MALYVPAGRRRRNLILGLVGALIVGLLLGAVVGRLTAPTLSDQVSSVQDSAREITARLRATPIEYQKQLSGSSEFRGGGTVAQSLAEAQATLRDAVRDAEWLGPTQRKQLDAALDPLVASAKVKVPTDRYNELVETAATRIETGFGIDT